MSPPPPHVVLDVAWPPSDVAPPKITGSAGAEITQFHALRSGESAITYGCVATPIPGWVEDMRPAVEGRTVGLAGASAAVAAGHPIDARPNGRGGFELRDARHLEDAPIGNAKTFVGFDAKQVHTCFATCIGPACREHVDAARLADSTPPPSPGLALAVATWAVHHPRPVAIGFGAALVVVGFVAVVSRRRPRFRGA